MSVSQREKFNHAVRRGNHANLINSIAKNTYAPPLVTLFHGPGKISVDHFLRRRFFK